MDLGRPRGLIYDPLTGLLIHCGQGTGDMWSTGPDDAGDWWLL